MLAQSIARDSKLKDILALKQLVRIFIFHDGDSQKTIESIQSTIDQGYSYKEIFVVLLNKNQIENLNYDGEFRLIDAEKFPETLARSEGEFVQFISAGDRLLQDRIMHMVELMDSIYKFDVAFSEAIPPEHQNPAQTYIFMGYPKLGVPHPDNDIREFFGAQIVSMFAINGASLQAGISRGFFRQKLFKDKKLLSNWIKDGKFLARQMCLWKLISQRKIGFLNEKMIQASEEFWAQEDLKLYRESCLEIVEQLHESKMLPDAEYQKAKKKLS